MERLLTVGRRAAQALRHRLGTAAGPAGAAHVVGALAGANRRRSAPIAEKALLRH
jgi:hypothetical protein